MRANMRRRATGLLVLLAACVLSVAAGPLSTTGTRCSRTCSDESSKFDYEPGKTYEYEYKGEAVTSLPGADGHESQLEIKAVVKIDVVSKCDLILRLADVYLQHSHPQDPRHKVTPPNAEQFAVALTANPLHFAFQDGRIEELCSSASEPVWVLNLKRGVLSALQNSMRNLEEDHTVQETDVTGKCNAVYTVRRGWTRTSVSKTKNLLECRERNGHQTSMQSFPYESPSVVQSLPILNSTYFCIQHIEQKRIASASCTERHVFQPFSNQESGVTATIKQTLQLVSDAATSASATRADFAISSRSSLLFDHEFSQTSQTDDKREAEAVLRRLCDSTRDEIRPDVPALFSGLVSKLRQLKRSHLEELFNNIDSICGGNKKSRKFFLDGLQMTFTADAISLMKDVIANDRVSDLEADTWLLSVAFVPHPEKVMIQSLVQLVEVEKPRQKAVLSLSSLIHTYCKRHECESDDEMQTVLRSFLLKLGSDCTHSNTDDQSNTLTFLKAVGNMGYGRRAAALLERCYQKKENPVEVRIAAIEGLRRMQCGNQHKELMEVFSDHQEDTEVRIAAYLALMKCPSVEKISKIKELMHRDDLNQVSSFVWTHLTNIQESVDPCKRDVRILLRDHVLKKKFSPDSRKFSRAFEGSLYSEAMNTGVHTEGSLIFTPKSFLPRSASMNLTVDLFGESINLFEIGGRAEGFEHLIESFFGPNGYYPEETVTNFLQTFRGKRSVNDNKLGAIEHKFKSDEMRSRDEPHASMYMRVFGNDLHYATFSDLRNKDGTAFHNLLHKLFKAEEVDITKSFIFLDSRVIIPTAIGLPLNLTVNGTAIVNLQMKGHLDLDKIVKMDCDITGHLKPSAAVEINGMMAVDAFVMKSGLKLKATMHTATALSGKLQLRRGELVKIEMDAPKEKIEIINIKTDVMLIAGNEEHPHRGIVENRANTRRCSGPLTSQPLGVELCSELKYPDASMTKSTPQFLLTGSSSAAIYMIKTDPSLRHYTFEYRWENEKSSSDQYVRTRRLSFNTPGSSVDREFTAELIINEPQKAVTAALRTPFKKVGFNGQYTNEPQVKEIQASFIVDNREHSVLQAGLQIERNSDFVRLQPTLYIRTSDQPIVSVKGSSTIQPRRRITIDLLMEHLTSNPVTVQGDITRNAQDGLDVNLKMKSYLLTSSVKGHMLFGPHQWTSTLQVDFSSRNADMKKYEITTKYRDTSAGSEVKRSASLEVRGNTMEPLAFVWDLQCSSLYHHHSLEVSKGEGSGKKTFLLEQTFGKDTNGPTKKVFGNVKAACQTCGMDWQLRGSHQYNDSTMTTQAAIQYDRDQEAKIEVHAYKSLTVLMNHGSTVSVVYPGKRMMFNIKVQNPTADELDGEVKAEMSPARIMSAKAKYKREVGDNNDHSHKLSAELSLPDANPITLNGNIQTGDQNSAKAELEYDQKKYSASVDYEKNDNGHKGNVSIVLPKQRYMGDASFAIAPRSFNFLINYYVSNERHIQLKGYYADTNKTMQGSVDYKWNADKDPKQRLFASVELKRQPLGYEFITVAKCPQHTARFTLSTKTEGSISSPTFTHTTDSELEWGSNNTITASLNMNRVQHASRAETYMTVEANAPQWGLRKPHLTLSHIKSGQECNSAAKYEHEESIYEIRSNTRVRSWTPHPNFDSRLSITRPQEEPIEFTIEHRNTDREIKTKLGTKHYKVSLFGLNSSGHKSINFMGGVNVTITDKYSFGIQYLQGGGEVKGKTDIGYNNKFTIIEVNGESNTDLSKVDLIGTVNVYTPYAGYETISATARYNNDGSNLSSFLELIFDQEKRLTAEVVGSRQFGYNAKSITGSVHIVSTFGPINDVLLVGSHEQDDRNIKQHLELKWSEDKVIAYKMEKTRGPQYLKASAFLTTPFSSMKQITAQLHHALEKNVDTKVDFSYNKQRFLFEVGGSAIFSNGRRQLNGKASMRTPFEQLSEMQVSYSHSAEDGTCNNYVEVSWPGASVIINHSGTFKDWLNFQNAITIKTPYKNYERMGVDTRHQYAVNGFSHSSKFDVSGKIKYQILIENKQKEITNGFLQHMDITVQTPSEMYGPYQVELTWIKDEGEQNAAASIQFPEGYKLELGTVLSIGKKIGKGKVTFSAPFKGWENIIVSGNYDWRAEPAQISLDIQWSPHDHLAIEVNGISKLYERGFEVKIATPFTNYEKLSFGGRYNIQHSVKELVCFGAMGEKKYQFEAKRALHSSMNKIEETTAVVWHEVKLTTPHEEWRKLSLTTEFKVQDGTHSHKVTAQKEDDTIEVKIGYNPYNYSKFEIQVRTPFEGYQIVRGEFQYNHIESFLMILQKEAVSAKLTANIDFKEDFIEVSSQLASDYYNINTGIEGKYYKESDQHNIDCVLHYNRDRITSSGSLRHLDRGLTATVTVTTPIEDYEHIESIFKIERGQDRNIAIITVTRDGEKAEITASWIVSSDGAHISLSAVVPSLPAVGLSASYDTSTPAKTASLVTTVANERAQLSATFAYEYTRMEGTLEFTSNIGETDRDYAITFNKDFQATPKLMTLTLKKEGDSLTITGTFSPLGHSKGEVKVFADGTMLPYRQNSAIIQYDFDRSEKSVSVLGSSGSKHIQVTGKLMAENSVKQASLEVHTPFEDFEHLIISGKYDSNDGKNNVVTKIQKGDDVIELSGTMSINTVNGEVSMKAVTPYKNYESMSGVAGYDLTRPENSITLTLTSNDKKIDVRGTLQYDNTKADGSLIMNSSHEDFESFTSRGQIDISQPEKTVQLSLQQGSKLYEFSGSAMTSHSQGRVRTEAKTPYDEYRALSFIAQYDISRHDKSASISYQWAPGKEVKGNILLVLNRFTGDATVSVSTPFEKYEKADLSIRFNLYGADKNAAINLQYGQNKKVEAVVELHTQQHRANLHARVTTPFKDYNHYQLTASYDMSSPAKTAQVVVKWPNQIWKEAQFNYAGRGTVKQLVDLNLVPNEESDKIQVKLSYDVSSMNKEGKIYGHINGNETELLVRVNTEQLSGEATFKSPYESVKSISITGGLLSSSSMKTAGTLKGKWNSNTMNLDFTCNDQLCLTDNDLKFELDTSLDGMEKVNFTLKYNFVKPKKELTLLVKSREDMIKLTFNGIAGHAPLNVSVRFTSTIPSVKILSAGISCNKTEALSFTIMHVQWAEDKKILLTIEGQRLSEKQGVTAKLTTPFENFESAELSGHHTVNKKEHTVNIYATDRSRKIKVYSYLNRDTNNPSIKLKLNTHFTEPVSISGNYDLTKKQKNALLTIEWGQSQKIELQGNMEVKNSTAKGEFLISSSFDKIEDMNIAFEYNGYQPKKTAEIKFQYGSDEISILCEIQTPFEPQYVSANLTIKSTFPTFKLLALKSMYHRSSADLTGMFSLDWTEQDHIKMTANIRPHKYLVTLDTPIRPFHNVQLSGSAVKTSGSLVIKSGLEWEDDNKLSFSLDVNHDLPHSMDVTAKLVTPIESFSEVSAIINHKNDENHLETSVILNTPFENLNSVTAKVICKNESTRNIERTISLETPEKRFNLHTIWEQDLPNSAHGKLTVESTFSAIPSIIIEAKYQNEDWDTVIAELRSQLPNSTHAISISSDIQSGNINSHLEIVSPWINEKNIVLQVSGVYGNGRMQGDITLDTPNSKHAINANLQYDSTNVKGNIIVNKNFKMNLDLKLNPSRNEFSFTTTSTKGNHEVIGTWRTDNGLEVAISMKTPLLKIRSISFAVVPSANAIKVTLDITTMNANHKFAFAANRDNTATAAKIEVETPFFNIEKATVGGSVQNNQLQIFLKTPSTMHQVTASGSTNKDTTTAQVTLETPFLNIDTMTAIARLSKSKWTNINCELSLETSSHVHTISITFVNDGHKLESQVTLKTPLFNINTLSWSASLVKQQENAEISLIFSTPQATHTFSAKIQHESESTTGISVHFRIETPLFNINTMMLSFRVASVFNHKYDASVTLATSQHEHSFVVAISKESNVIQLNANLQTPAFGIDYATFKCKLITEGIQNIELSATFDTPHAKHVFRAAFQSFPTSTIAEVTMKLPWLHIKSFSIKLKLINDAEQNKVLQVTVTTDRHQHTADATLRYDLRSLFGKLQLASPFLHPTTITGNMNGNRSTNGNFLLDIMSGQKSFNISGNYKNNNFQTFEGSVDINTPFRELKNVKAKVQYNYDRFEGASGKLEIHTSNPKFDAFTIEGTFHPSRLGVDMTLNAETPFASVKTITIEGSVTYDRAMTELTPRFTVSIADRKYEVFGHFVNKPQEISINAGAQYNSKKFEVSMSVKFERQSWDSNFRLAMPNTREINVNVKKSGRPNYESQEWEAEVKYGTKKFAIKTEYSPIQAKLELQTPYHGFDHTSLMYIKKVDQEQKEFVIELVYGHEKTIRLQTQLNLQTIEVKLETPFLRYKTLVLMCVAKEDGFKLDIVKNDHSIFELQYSLQGASHTVHMTTLNHPMTATFTQAKTRQGWTIDGMFSSNTNRGTEATSGFHIEKKHYDNGGYELVVHVTRGTKALKFKTLTQTTAMKFVHETELVWDEQSHCSASYKIKLEDKSSYEQINYIALATLTYGDRSLELNLDHKNTEADSIHEATFKWDAKRDTSKQVGVKMEYHDTSDSRKGARAVEFTLTHPVLEKGLIIRAEYTTNNDNVLFSAKASIEYSRYQRQHLTFEAKVMNDKSMNYESSYNLEVALKHQISNLDLRFQSDWTNNKDVLENRMLFSYMDRQGQKQTSLLLFKVRKYQKQVDFQIKYPGFTLEMTGQAEVTDDQYVGSMQGSLNGKLPLIAKIQINKKTPQVLLNFIHTNEEHKSWTMIAGMPTRKLLNLVLYHSEGGQHHVKDLMLMAKLNNSRVLDIKAEWNMSNIMSAISGISTEYDTAATKWNETKSIFYTFLGEEASDKLGRLFTSLSKSLNPMMQDLGENFGLINRDAKLVSQHFNKMYRDNTFYTRDIVDSTKSVTNYIPGLNTVYRGFVNGATHCVDYAYATFHRMIMGMKQLPGVIGEKSQNAVEEVGRTIQIWRDSAHRWTQDSHEAMRTAHRHVANALIDLLCHLQDKVRPLIKSLSPTFNRYLDRICDRVQNVADATADYLADLVMKGKSIPILGTLCDFVSEEVMETLSEYYNQLLLKMSEWMNTTSDTYDRWSSHPQVKLATEITKDTYEKAAWAYDYWNVEENVKNTVYRLFDHTRDFFLDLLHDFTIEYPHIALEASGETEFHPDKGHFKHTQHLPVDWPNFDEIPSFSNSTGLHKLKEWKDRTLANIQNLSVWDTYYKYKSNLFTFGDHLPPFNTYALLSGKQHYMTFDRRFFEFAGKCSYLLAHDFIDRNFTAIVNYEGESGSVRKKSLFFIFKETKIEVGTDFTITLNSRKTELPFEIDGVRVTRESNTVRLASKYGVDISCNFGVDICVVRMSGWYFGKTGGLFGTYDNEAKTDFITSDRRNVEDVVEFASSWEIGSSRCKTTTNLATVAQRVDLPVCNAFFKDSQSPLARCFSKVTPDDFHRMCTNDVTDSNSNDAEEAACTAVATYVTECKLEEVPIEIPNSCVRCKGPNNKMLKSSVNVTLTDSAVPRSSDVVVVVEEKQCNGDVKLLEELVKGIETGLRMKRLVNNRYAVVAFGGDGVHDLPHIHTIDGKIFGNERSIITTAFSNLQIGNGQTGLVHAIQMAAKLRFRPGVSKNILVLPCSDSEDYQTSDYDQIHHLLQRQNIKLHLLSPQAFEMKGGRKMKSKEVIGIDSKAAYTVKDVQDKTLDGDSDLLTHVITPKTLPVALALHSHGSVFARQALTSTKPKMAKPAHDVFTRRIALTSLPAQCQTCHCVADKFGEGQTVCMPCPTHQITTDEQFYTQLHDYTEGLVKETSSKKPKNRPEKARGAA